MTCTQRRLRSAWSVSSLCTLWVTKGPKVSLGGQRRVWSDCADAQTDLNLHWACRSFGWFCHAVAQVVLPERLLSQHADGMANTVDPHQIVPSDWTSSLIRVQVDLRQIILLVLLCSGSLISMLIQASSQRACGGCNRTPSWANYFKIMQFFFTKDSPKNWDSLKICTPV